MKCLRCGKQVSGNICSCGFDISTARILSPFSIEKYEEEQLKADRKHIEAAERTRLEAAEPSRLEIQETERLIDDNGTVVGLCGIGEVKSDNDYALDIGKHRDVLYVVVSQDYQRQGIGTMLLKSCLRDIHDYPVIYEAWGEIKNGDVNSYKMLAKCSFELLADKGTSFYRDHGYCPYCVNKGRNCQACFCKIYIYR